MGLENSINNRKLAALCAVALATPYPYPNQIWYLSVVQHPPRGDELIMIISRVLFASTNGCGVSKPSKAIYLLHLRLPVAVTMNSSLSLFVCFCFHVVSQNRHTYMTYKMPSWLYHPLLSQLFWVLEIRFENIRRPNKWRMASIEDNNIMCVESYCARNKRLLIKRCWQSIPSV